MGVTQKFILISVPGSGFWGCGLRALLFLAKMEIVAGAPNSGGGAFTDSGALEGVR